MEPFHEQESVGAADGTKLALQSWSAVAPRAVIFYIPGLQSHAGWLFETGPALARHGVTVCALDRRGAGRSGGPRGDTPSFQTWLSDYAVGAEIVRDRHQGLPFTLLGQSMGGSLAAALAHQTQIAYDALVLCAPALNMLHVRMSPAQQAELRHQAAETECPILLRDEWYTRDERYLSFMRSDPLMLRVVTARHRLAALDLESFYAMPEVRRSHTKPAALILPRRDSILDLSVVRRTFDDLGHQNSTIVEFPSDDHYLEFSRCRVGLWSFVAHFATSGGYGFA
jgi:alpha-beta hydrolase superfamily lysophospholipase